MCDDSCAMAHVRWLMCDDSPSFSNEICSFFNFTLFFILLKSCRPIRISNSMGLTWSWVQDASCTVTNGHSNAILCNVHLPWRWRCVSRLSSGGAARSHPRHRWACKPVQTSTHTQPRSSNRSVRRFANRCRPAHTHTNTHTTKIK